MSVNKLYIGVDVGSTELIISEGIKDCSPKFTKLITTSISNTIESINTWLTILPPDAHIINEETGTYSLNLNYCLTLAGVDFTIITPTQSKGFAQTMKVSHQNDAIDASLLALYGANYKPEKSIIEDDYLHHLKQKHKHLSSLITQKQVVENQLHALSFDPRPEQGVIDSLTLLQATFQTQIDKFKQEIFTLDKQEYQHLYKLICSVVGIGEASANALLIACNGFKNFLTVKQVLKFLGLVPAQKESSKSVRNNYGLAKTGVAYVRAILYMAARAAKKHNLACKDVYDRQRANNKPHKVAMIAVINKLIRQVFGVVKNQTFFSNHYEFAK